MALLGTLGGASSRHATSHRLILIRTTSYGSDIQVVRAISTRHLRTLAPPTHNECLRTTLVAVEVGGSVIS